MKKSKAVALLVLLVFAAYALVVPVLTVDQAWAQTLRSGTRGSEVQEAQSRLNSLGFWAGTADGIFGLKTLSAVKAFQRKMKLWADGIVGPNTWAVLRRLTPWYKPAVKAKTVTKTPTAKPSTTKTTTTASTAKTSTTKTPTTTSTAKTSTTKTPTTTPTAGASTTETPSTTSTGKTSTTTPTQSSQTAKTSQGSQSAQGSTVPGSGSSAGAGSTTGQTGSGNGTGAGSTTGQTGSGSSAGSAGTDPTNSAGQAGQSTVGDSTQVSRGDAGTPAGIPKAAPGKMVLGFTAEDYVGDTNSYNSVANFGQNVDAIATFTYYVDGKGNLNLQTPVPRNTIQSAKAQGIRPLALIHNYQNGFNKDVARTLMTSATARKNLINQLLAVLPREGYDGINVDLEGLYPGDSAAYIQLLTELKAALKPKGYWLTVSIPAKTADNPNDAWSGAFNYKAIGGLADHVLIMTYDQNWIGGAPGPIAGQPWVEKVIQYAVSQIPAQKILLGLATYGYDWGVPSNKALSYPKAVALAKQYGAVINWDNTNQVSWFQYKDAQGNLHKVWFEDQRSAKAKLQLVTKYGLAGVGIWRLGYEDSLYWDVIKDFRAG